MSIIIAILAFTRAVRLGMDGAEERFASESELSISIVETIVAVVLVVLCLIGVASTSWSI